MSDMHNFINPLQTADIHTPKENHLLSALSSDVQDRLFSFLELVPLPRRSFV